MVSFVLVLLVGCGVPECQDLCAARAACVSTDIAEAGSTWEEWTGYADESAYQEACADVFVASLKGGSSRGDLRDLCEAESAATCDEL